jgi:hypothetical protein
MMESDNAALCRDELHWDGFWSQLRDRDRGSQNHAPVQRMSRRHFCSGAAIEGRGLELVDPLHNALSEYFGEVAGENAKQALAQPGNLRLATNAIMTLDGFFGALHAELLQIGLIKEASDDKWKEVLAADTDHYRVLRDAAYALKYGVLTHKKPRVIRRSDQVLRMPGAFSSGFSTGFNVDQVWIEGIKTDYQADEVIKDVVSEAAL